VFTASQSKNQPLREGEKKKKKNERRKEKKRRQQTEALCLHISIAFGT
jgi:hypothetical protein